MLVANNIYFFTHKTLVAISIILNSSQFSDVMHYLYKYICILNVFIYVYGQFSTIKNLYYIIYNDSCLGNFFQHNYMNVFFCSALHNDSINIVQFMNYSCEYVFYAQDVRMIDNSVYSVICHFRTRFFIFFY